MGTPLNNSVIKAFDILRVFPPHATGISASQVARKLGMTTATAHRFLLTLVDVGALRRDDKGQFQLGMLLADLGDRVAHDAVLGQAVQPHIDTLVRELRESVSLAVMDGDAAVVAASGEPDRSLRIGMPVGRRMPLHASAVGKALLAHQPMPRIEALLAAMRMERLTEHSIVEPDRLREHLQLIRREGFAVDREEMEDGLRCVAVPLFGDHGLLKGALSISVPSARLDQERQGRYVEELRRHAREISQRVGIESRVFPSKAPPRGPFPHLKRVGNLIFVSGTSARRPDNSFEGAFVDAQGRVHLDIRAQTRATIGNIVDMLEGVQAGIEHVVDLEAFLVDIADYQAFNEVYAEYFGDSGPARATVAVKALPHPHQLLMIKAIAVSPDPR
jgi:DNA-binding IclR family transcriptional regulator/enamine deaminase RidA (YjgF/YER057c/UK114 family)